MALANEDRVGVDDHAPRSEFFAFPAIILTAFAVVAGCGESRADVFEIGADGSVVVLAGPTARTGSAQTNAEGHDAPAVLRRAAERADLSPDLVSAVAWTESRFDPNARSHAGAVGMMQLMPATAADLGVDVGDVEQNARGGAQYLRQMLDEFGGDLTLALAAYNAGPGAVRRHGGVPPYAETQRYVESVLSFLAERATEESASQ